MPEPTQIPETRYRIVCYELEADQETVILDATAQAFIDWVHGYRHRQMYLWLVGGELEKVGTRFVGFWDGFTQPVFGGTAALRSALGLNGGLNQCSSDYQIANKIGGYTLDAEAVVPLLYGGATSVRVILRGLGANEGEVVTGNLFSQLASTLPDAEIARLRAAGATLLGTWSLSYFEVLGLQAVSPAKSGSSTCGCS
jgi:hypothetical protein